MEAAIVLERHSQKGTVVGQDDAMSDRLGL
jgi:GTPase Era involved in 16S rRNA processing